MTSNRSSILWNIPSAHSEKVKDSITCWIQATIYIYLQENHNDIFGFFCHEIITCQMAQSKMQCSFEFFRTWLQWFFCHALNLWHSNYDLWLQVPSWHPTTSATALLMCHCGATVKEAATSGRSVWDYSVSLPTTPACVSLLCLHKHTLYIDISNDLPEWDCKRFNELAWTHCDLTCWSTVTVQIEFQAIVNLLFV